jgi:hypothetical protein
MRLGAYQEDHSRINIHFNNNPDLVPNATPVSGKTREQRRGPVINTLLADIMDGVMYIHSSVPPVGACWILCI